MFVSTYGFKVRIDEDVLQEVVKMGYDRNQLIESLCNRLQNEGTVAYYLLFDKHFRASRGYLAAEFQEIKLHAYVFPENHLIGMHSNEVTFHDAGHQFRGCDDCQGKNFPIEKKCSIGLQVGCYVLTSFLISFCWKKIGHYSMKCKWIPGILGHHEVIVDNPVHSSDKESSIAENDAVLRSPNAVKFELQLYKAPEEKYLLDLRWVQGPHILFLDLCTVFLAQFRVL